MAIKRGKGQRLIPLEELRAEERSGMEPADPITAEMIYERRWALTVLDHVLSRLKDKYRTAGNAALFDSLNQLLADEPGAPSQAEIAAQLGDDRKRVSQASTISAKLSSDIARGNCQYRCDSRRYRRRAAPSHCGA